MLVDELKFEPWGQSAGGGGNRDSSVYHGIGVGGPGYFFGPVIGAAVGVILPEWLRFAQAWYLTVFGFAVVALMIWLPDGLLSIPDRIRARKQSKAASAARAASAKQIGEAS